MSIIINKDTKVICQGMTGKEGTFQTLRTLKYGTNVVAGVTPGKGGMEHLGLPVFNTMLEAVQQTGAKVSIIYVPITASKAAMLEAVNAGIEIIICITEGIPVHDILEVKSVLKEHKCILIGPNTPGVITPGESLLGIMSDNIFKKGGVGVISRSGTLTYEAIKQLTDEGIGQSTCIGIGGDPIIGTDIVFLLDKFEKDSETKQILIIGEIGGSFEEDAALYIKKNVSKPVFAYIAGKNVPKGKRMGHAGAIIKGESGNYENKIRSLKEAGICIIDDLNKIGESISKKNKSYHTYVT
ncbi:MAG: succinate--CoA ligase subunit alpha [Candidatus Pacebacteria bacterium]|nr:succinate--CoA ligase subunit alpha [Candidatus Paceibacterota bacterium]